MVFVFMFPFYRLLPSDVTFILSGKNSIFFYLLIWLLSDLCGTKGSFLIFLCILFQYVAYRFHVNLNVFCLIMAHYFFLIPLHIYTSLSVTCVQFSQPLILVLFFFIKQQVAYVNDVTLTESLSITFFLLFYHLYQSENCQTIWKHINETTCCMFRAVRSY